MQDMTAARASETFTVMASSSRSAPTIAPKVSFSRPIWGKM
jgi:hypothetical protein